MVSGHRCKAASPRLLSRYTPRAVPLEPTIDVAQQNTASLRCNHSKIARSAWAGLQQRSARKSLLSVGGHDRLSRRAARRWIATAPCVLAEQSRAAALIRPWPVRSGLGQHLYSVACYVHGHQPEADQSAETAHAGIPVASALVAGTASQTSSATAHALDGLQQQIETEAALHLHDCEPLRLTVLYSDGIAAVHLALYAEARFSRKHLTAG